MGLELIFHEFGVVMSEVYASTECMIGKVAGPGPETLRRRLKKGLGFGNPLETPPLPTGRR